MTDKYTKKFGLYNNSNVAASNGESYVAKYEHGYLTNMSAQAQEMRTHNIEDKNTYC